jgi:hypothetical protein
MPAPQSPQSPPSVEITRAGWVALILSLAAGIGLRIALQVWYPERFVQTSRNDPHQGGLGAMFMIPVFALCVWVVCTLLGYPLIRTVKPPPTSDRDPDAP